MSAQDSQQSCMNQTLVPCNNPSKCLKEWQKDPKLMIINLTLEITLLAEGVGVTLFFSVFFTLNTFSGS